MNESKVELMDRLRREGRWSEASKDKDETLRTLRSQGMTKAEAGEAAWEAMAEKYPPQAQAEAAAVNVRVQGLGEIPASWPELADNSSLQAELAWVQSNRLRVVEEKSSGATRVYLARARSPAPSWAALSWLETSIRSYAKFADVVARSLKDEQDDQANIRRERMAIEEIRELLAEMHEDGPEGA